MKYSVYVVALFPVIVALLIPSSTLARDVRLPHSYHQGTSHGQKKGYPAWPRTRAHSRSTTTNTLVNPSYSNGKRKHMMEEETNEHPLQIVGSRLPDCSHACGSCSPCKLVIVGSLCGSLSRAAETCPVSYRCMCNNKSYPVP